MPIHFHKYQATGNDFVLIDNRQSNRKFSTPQIQKICDRRFGVGADGLILIENDNGSDFEMIYYNSDGSQSLCGNGCRSAVDFASALKIIGTKTSFRAYDGIHEASLLDSQLIKLKMNDVKNIKSFDNDYFIDTGSPHYIQFVKNLNEVNVLQSGRELRHHESFKPGGTNVNFVTLQTENTIAVRTYERGVEDETLSCGTGVTAAALAAHFKGYHSPVNVAVRGGQLAVEFKFVDENTKGPKSDDVPGSFVEVFLIGPAKMVFEGDLEL